MLRIFKNFIISILFKIALADKNRHSKKLTELRISNQNYGICSVVDHNSVDRFIATIFTFYEQSNLLLPIYLINDGSLTQLDKKKLKSYLHNIKIVDIKETEKSMRKLLKKYPFLTKFRFTKNTTVLKIKLDAILLCPYKKFLYLDSDILFFNRPTELVDFFSRNERFNLFTCRKHINIANELNWDKLNQIENYFRKMLFEKFDNTISHTFNSGLFCISGNDTLDLKKMDTVMQYLFQNGYAYSWLTEETVLAFAFSKNMRRMLNVQSYKNISTYDDYKHIQLKSLTSLHYSGDSGLKTKMMIDFIKIWIE